MQTEAAERWLIVGVGEGLRSKKYFEMNKYEQVLTYSMYVTCLGRYSSDNILNVFVRVIA
jgi:hypothetical protein